MSIDNGIIGNERMRKVRKKHYIDIVDEIYKEWLDLGKKDIETKKSQVITNGKINE